jgi:hypothetical protein
MLSAGYPLLGGTRQRHFAGTNFKPRKLPDCPKGVRTPRSGSPTTTAPTHFGGDRVHAVLGGWFLDCHFSNSEICLTVSGIGRGPFTFKYAARDSASSCVKLPAIIPLPSVMGELTFGADITTLSNTMPR